MISLAIRVVGLSVALTQPLPTDCDESAKDLLSELHRSQVAMEPEGVVAHVLSVARGARSACVHSEAMTYVYLRSSELRAHPRFGAPDPDQSWRGELARAAVRFPRSSRVLTLVARCTENVDDARHAFDVDPNYAPAAVALARALVRLGRGSEAVAVLLAHPELRRVSDGPVTLAEAQLAAGNVDAAIRQAKLAIHPFISDPVEPDARLTRPDIAPRVILGKAYLSKRRSREALKELSKVQAESEEARDLLSSSLKSRSTPRSPASAKP